MKEKTIKFVQRGRPMSLVLTGEHAGSLRSESGGYSERLSISKMRETVNMLTRVYLSGRSPNPRMVDKINMAVVMLGAMTSSE